MRLAARLLLFVVGLHACSGLALSGLAVTRRTALEAACAAALFRQRAAWADDEDKNFEDEIPDPGRPVPKRKQSAAAAPKDLKPADGKVAALQILAARQKLDSVDTLVAAKDFAALRSLLDSAPLSTFEANALVLVQSKALDPQDVKAIGTIKRYGVGADVIIMLGGLGAAAQNSDASEALSYLSKAKASLDEILVICKGNKLV